MSGIFIQLVITGRDIARSRRRNTAARIDIYAAATCGDRLINVHVAGRIDVQTSGQSVQSMSCPGSCRCQINRCCRKGVCRRRSQLNRVCIHHDRKVALSGRKTTYIRTCSGTVVINDLIAGLQTVFCPCDVFCCQIDGCRRIECQVLLCGRINRSVGSHIAASGVQRHFATFTHDRRVRGAATSCVDRIHLHIPATANGHIPRFAVFRSRGIREATRHDGSAQIHVVAGIYVHMPGILIDLVSRGSDVIIGT